MARLLLCLSSILALAAPARAHESRPAYLELREGPDALFDVLWKVPARGEFKLALHPRFPADCTVGDEPVRFMTADSFVERATLACPDGLEGSEIAIDGLVATKTDVLVRVVRASGAVQTVRLTPARPSFTVAARPSALGAAWSFTKVGFEHILLGADHLLFVLGLLLIVRDRRRLVWTVTAFTAAHSLTLALATLGLARVPEAALNATIALSILFLGPEIVRTWRGETSTTIRRPYLVSFAFGLLHGFGFASGLATIGMPRGEIVTGLLWFNAGVELGQLAFVFLVLALARSFRVLEVRWPAWAARLPGYVVGTSGAYWTIQRVLVLAGAG